MQQLFVLNVRRTRREGAMLEALLLLACQIAPEVANWSPQQQDRLEACREFCRSVCTELGRTPKTECLATLWILITMVQCKLGGTSGHDIDASGMACPSVALGEPSELLKKMNPYRRRAFKKDIEIINDVLPGLEPFDPLLFKEVLSLSAENDNMISD
eukprot:s659_g24.t1